MIYAVRKGRVPGLYFNKEEALEQTVGFPFNEMRIFTNKKDANKYLHENEELFYVVKRGRIPGIYFSKEDVSVQVKGFENPIVKTFRDKVKAEEFFAKDISEINFIDSKTRKEQKEKRKKEYAKKIEEYLNDGISVHNKNICFIDIEANNNKAISLGAVIYDSETKEILDSFYSLMRYSDFISMDSFCEKINHIKTEDVLAAEESDKVMLKFISFINKYNVLDIFSWGNSDKHFLYKTLDDKSLYDEISHIRNIQTFISYATKDIVLNKTWSLESMKSFYGIEGKVTHNALMDAFDLVKVFECFQSKKEVNKEVVLKHVV